MDANDLKTGRLRRQKHAMITQCPFVGLDLRLGGGYGYNIALEQMVPYDKVIDIKKIPKIGCDQSSPRDLLVRDPYLEGSSGLPDSANDAEDQRDDTSISDISSVSDKEVGGEDDLIYDSEDEVFDEDTVYGTGNNENEKDMNVMVFKKVHVEYNQNFLEIDVLFGAYHLFV